MDRMVRRQLKDYVKSFLRPKNLLSAPRVLDQSPPGNVLVFSPHFDDDIFGCGGTLHKHALAGDSVTVAYFTDGREGDPSVSDKAAVECTRKEEARRATALLGISDLVFLDQPETHLKPTPPLLETVAELVRRVQPRVVYLPWFGDNHVDHFELNRILLRLRSHVFLGFAVRGYEIWTPLIPNIVVDITDVVARKQAAAEQYVSQLKAVDYVNTVLALNRYRSMAVMQGLGYAEAFIEASAEEYVGLLRHLKVSRRIFVDAKYVAPVRRLARVFGG